MGVAVAPQGRRAALPAGPVARRRAVASGTQVPARPPWAITWAVTSPIPACCRSVLARIRPASSPRPSPVTTSAGAPERPAPVRRRAGTLKLERDLPQRPHRITPASLRAAAASPLAARRSGDEPGTAASNRRAPLNSRPRPQSTAILWRAGRSSAPVNHCSPGPSPAQHIVSARKPNRPRSRRRVQARHHIHCLRIENRRIAAVRAAIAVPDLTSSSIHRKPAMPACQTAIRSPRANLSRRVSICVRLNPRVEGWSCGAGASEVFPATIV